MQTIFITGCSGYIGSLLVDHLSKREDVISIIGLDKEPLPKLIQENKKLYFIQKNTADDWQDEVAQHNPTTVIHTAWQIRELYGNKELQNKWNIEGSCKVFNFAFTQPTVKKLFHFGSVASYGAFASNDIEHIMNEQIALRKCSYLYAEEKRISEAMLEDIYKKHSKDNPGIQVYILRPVSITGPHGRRRTKFSLQSILKGTANDNIFSRTISRVMSFMPVTHTWVRQFIHEDDVVCSIEHIIYTNHNQDYTVLNLCPYGNIITGEEMASILSKKNIYIHPQIIRIIFFIFWHLSRGRIPTPRGSWMTYSYPIVVDGTKITNDFGYKYKFSNKEAISLDKGQYL